ncbi:MAG: hypothetical protein ACT4OM_05470 [Actinomycetota bacterium]
MIKRMMRLTGIVRLMDFRQAGNRLAALGSMAAAAAGGLFAVRHGAPLPEAAFRGIEAGLVVFLGWAIAREIDPDHPGSATVALLFSGLILFSGRPNLAGLLGIALAVRILLRSTGKPPKATDLLFLIGLAAYSAGGSSGVAAGVALAISVSLNTRLPFPAPRFQVLPGALMGIATMVSAVLSGSLAVGWSAPVAFEWIILGAFAGACLLLRVPAPESRDDCAQAQLLRVRLAWATRLAAGTGWAAFALGGGKAVPELASLWAAVIAVATYRLRHRPPDLPAL